MTPATILVPVPPSILPLEWTDDVEAMIEAANPRLPGEPFDVRLLRRDCAVTRRQLWLVKKAGRLAGLGVTGIHVADDGRRTLYLMLVAGQEWPSWSWALGAIEAWGREQQCSVARVEGRSGWGRRLPAAYRLTGETCGARGLVWERSLFDG